VQIKCNLAGMLAFRLTNRNRGQRMSIAVSQANSWRRWAKRQMSLSPRSCWITPPPTVGRIVSGRDGAKFNSVVPTGEQVVRLLDQHLSEVGVVDWLSPGSAAFADRFLIKSIGEEPTSMYRYLPNLDGNCQFESFKLLFQGAARAVSHRGQTIREEQLAMVRSDIATAATMAVLGTGLLAACGGDKTECKDAPYKTAVRFELKSVFEPGKDNPEIEAAKAQAQSKWEAEVKGKFGPEWANWSGIKSRKLNCGAPPTDPKAWTCEAEAAPCKKG